MAGNTKPPKKPSQKPMPSIKKPAAKGGKKNY